MHDSVQNPLAILRESQLAPGVFLLCQQIYGTLRAAFDPAQTSQAAARVLLAEAAGQYPNARAVAFTDAGRTVITHLPEDERPVQIARDADGQLTVTYDDTRMTGEQFLALVDKAATL